MTRVFGPVGRVAPAACLVFLLLGCGGPRLVTVDGKLLANGQPYAPPSGAKLSLSLVGNTDNGPKTYPAAINAADGSFTAANVPPGKYKVMLNLAPESTDPASLAAMSAAGAVFAPVNGKEIDVPDQGAKSVVIDVAKGTVSS